MTTHPDKLDTLQAAEFLGVTIRTLERWKAAGRLTARTFREGRTQKTYYDRAELVALKAELDAGKVSPRLDAPTHADTDRQAVAVRDSDTLGPADLAPIAETLRMIFEAVRTGQAADAVNRRLDTIADEVRKLRRDDHPPVADLAHKLTLTTSDAATLSGLPVATIRDAIRRRALPSFGRGRGRRIRRTDLDAWIAGL